MEPLRERLKVTTAAATAATASATTAQRYTLTLLLVLATCGNVVRGYPCGWPGQPLNGLVTPHSQLFYPGEKANVTCAPGYVRFGRERRTCTADGTWDGLMPICKENVAYGGSTQGPPAPAIDGRLSPAAQSNHGRAVDGDMSTCSQTPRELPERWWQVRLAARTRVESVGLVVPPGGQQLDISIFIISLNATGPQSVYYQRCANFSGPLPQAKRLFRCGGAGLFGEYVYIRDERRHRDYLTLCEVEVFRYGVQRECGAPEQPAHGRVMRPDANSATYRCHTGYRLAGRHHRRCSRGEWTDQQPVCRRIFCERPPPLENGHLDVTVPSVERYSYNTTAMYRCAAGYSMHAGPGQRTCTAAGRWSGVMPRCQPLVCPMPEHFDNASYRLLNGTTRWQAMAQYSCQDGFFVQPDSGALITHCQDSAQWLPLNFSCAAAPAGGVVGDGADAQSETMSSGVVAGLLVAAVLAIAAMIVIGIIFTRRRVWQRRKQPDSANPPPPAAADVKTYDQVYEPSYQNVVQGPPPALLSFRSPAGSQRSSAAEVPRGRPVEPPYETLMARQAAGQLPPQEDTYEAVAGDRLYDDVAGDGPDSGPYQSLTGGEEPDYETLRAGRTDASHYDLVPVRTGCGPPHGDHVASTYENCQFGGGAAAATPPEVPDLLKGAPPPTTGGQTADIPPEILALYAKVVKSKKRHEPATADPPLPAGADSACPSSPGSSAASSYTRNLIDKFNRLATSDVEDAAGTAPSPTGQDKVQYTQIDCGASEAGGSELRRPPAEPVLYSTLRPLPPVPPDA